MEADTLQRSWENREVCENHSVGKIWRCCLAFKKRLRVLFWLLRLVFLLKPMGSIQHHFLVPFVRIRIPQSVFIHTWMHLLFRLKRQMKDLTFPKCHAKEKAELAWNYYLKGAKVGLGPRGKERQQHIMQHESAGGGGHTAACFYRLRPVRVSVERACCCREARAR